MLSLVRRLAQRVRHSPRLSFLSPLWPVLRKPYLALMTILGQRSGIPMEIAGCRFRIHPHFCTISLEAAEAASFHAFADAVQEGARVFDIGASVGPYTMIALERAGPSGRIVAYEPDECARSYLMCHLRWNARPSIGMAGPARLHV